MKPFRFRIVCLLLAVSLSAVAQQRAYRHRSDKQTLADRSPTIMPYNRLAKSAGTVLTYGDPRQENHTLDVALLPGGTQAVVEDRYGIAVIDRASQKIVHRWSFRDLPDYKALMSTFSGIEAFVYQNQTYIVWGASEREKGKSGVMVAKWAEGKVGQVDMIPFGPVAPSPLALPNDVAVSFEGDECYLYVVLNGNNQLAKVRFKDRSVVWTVPTGVAPFGVALVNNKLYVSNWGGPRTGGPRPDGPRTGSAQGETAGVPYGEAFINPKTGATRQGTVSVFNPANGQSIKEIEVGLHPNALVVRPDKRALYVANGNSDNISVIDPATDAVTGQIPIGLFASDSTLIGSSPNGLAIDEAGNTLFVANGLDHAVAVVTLGEKPTVAGYIPTEAYPSGMLWTNNTLYVTNLEARGARVANQTPELKKRFPNMPKSAKGAYNAHEQLASLSIIPVPNPAQLATYTKQVKTMNLTFRQQLSKLLPRPNIRPVPVPERTGEPSVFKHVIYIIKENRTYDQVYGDLKQGRGMPSLCIYGDSITPNQHKLALTYSLLDNYHAAGKSSAEGHQWTDAGMVSDYIEKNVRAWFRSYPHRQYDAMVYSQHGFIWNHALDHGKSVRIYGEACFTEFDESLKWADIYQKYLKKEPFDFKNTSTISRVRPILSQDYPGYDDPKINDQLRADAFIREIKHYEQLPGDSLPELMILALPNDHTAGTTPGFPTPRAMVADNDLALGKIMEALTHSRFWESTVVFVTEDDSQGGWDHISSYRTGALVLSPYSKLGRTVRTNYNQISMLRTIELILGLPPMNPIDATALPMFDCFTNKSTATPYTVLPNRIPLDEMNKPLTSLSGPALKFAKLSARNAKEGTDKGDDDQMNRILWFAAKGKLPYPSAYASAVKSDDDDG
ncbi:bifunctional YncE family protein/alkaline phosphatase family protein [Spirosoma soli]|uniref:Bifunctional YncE family protein/alkaline phosphatase family protein n=1 Tax=Spirosoma soli TaxID=1770529 RepID=A0ABW5M2K4_9BACT